MLHGTGHGDLTAVDEEDLIDVVDGVQAVRDDDLGCGLGQGLEDLFEKLFGYGVDIRGGFVKDP